MEVVLVGMRIRGELRRRVVIRRMVLDSVVDSLTLVVLQSSLNGSVSRTNPRMQNSADDVVVATIWNGQFESLGLDGDADDVSARSRSG